MALFTAKKRVVDDYLFVGLTEAFDKSIMLFEKLLPVFFTGALENLLKNSSKWQLRRSQGKRPVSKETLRYFQTSMIWRAENDFYQFVQHQFHATWSALDRDLQLYYPMNKENRISGVRYESIHRAAAPPPNDDT